MNCLSLWKMSVRIYIATLVGLSLVAGLGFVALRGADAHHAPVPDPNVVARLQALGYVDRVNHPDDISRVGVVYHDPRAHDGLTLYKSRVSPQAHLINLDGKILHTWTELPLDIEPEPPAGSTKPRGNKKNLVWNHIKVLPGGALLGIVENRHIEKIDWDSHLLWRTTLTTHHDFDVAPDGRIFALTQGFADVQTPSGPVKIVDNGIAVLSASGEILRENSLAPLFLDRVNPDRLDALHAGAGDTAPHGADSDAARDIFHANTIQILRRDVPGLGKAGQALVSIRELDLIAVIDLDAPAVVWTWGAGEIERAHQPSVMPNGHVLIFDNGPLRRYSRLIELDPVTSRIVWQYEGSPRSAFFLAERGGVQWLPGDHFLVADSDQGRAFEIDRDRNLLWEFLNPDVDQNTRGVIYRIERLGEELTQSLPLPSSVKGGA